MNPTFLMKVLLPNGNGAFLVMQFVKDTAEAAQLLHDQLVAATWADATQDELDAFTAAAGVVGNVLNGQEYVSLDGLPEDQKVLMREASARQITLMQA